MKYFRRALQFIFITGLFASCQPPSPLIKEAPPTAETGKAPTPEPERSWGNRAVLFYQVNSESDPMKLLEVLKSAPTLRMNLIFPPHYFEAEERQVFIESFRVLQSSGQIEIGLVLPNEPNLALISNLGVPGEKSRRWKFQYSWPEDAAAQIDTAKSQYKRLWGQSPKGLVPPYFALSEELSNMIGQLKFSWFLARPQPASAVKFYGHAALVIPVFPSTSTVPGQGKIQDPSNNFPLTSPFVFIDGSAWTANQEISYFKSLSKKISDPSFPVLMLGSEIRDEITPAMIHDSVQSAFQNDYSAWFLSEYQAQAWGALAEARQTIKTYENSGHAKLPRAKGALAEIYAAESGPFLLALGTPQQISLGYEKNFFVATLSNVYRHCEENIPAYLSKMFSGKKLTFAPTTSQVDANEPFYVPGKDSFYFYDMKGDDSGPGYFKYPIGEYPPGAFDLTRFKVNWSATNVRISATLQKLIHAQNHFIVPLVDVYMDINRLPRGGSMEGLKGRGNCSLEEAAAWEYAVSMTPINTILYQPNPGRGQRTLAIYKTSFNASENTLSVLIPLEMLRGKPSEWRFSVGVAATENYSEHAEPQPIPISAQSTERSFGGARTGRSPVRYVDVLAPTQQDQIDRLSAYESGENVTLPYAEVP